MAETKSNGMLDSKSLIKETMKRAEEKSQNEKAKREQALKEEKEVRDGLV